MTTLLLLPLVVLEYDDSTSAPLPVALEDFTALRLEENLTKISGNSGQLAVTQNPFVSGRETKTRVGIWQESICSDLAWNLATWEGTIRHCGVCGRRGTCDR